MFLLHPKQPLSVIASLIQSEISEVGKMPLGVSFHGADESTQEARETGPKTSRWAQSTELGDFVQDAALDSKFVIAIHGIHEAGAENGAKAAQEAENDKNQQEQQPTVVPIRVPTFQQRTKYLREHLVSVTKEMRSLLDIKTECDDLALVGAKRAAFAGFGGLLTYWGTVYWLTFHVYGWDLMEPVTYLTGLTGIMGGYLWFLYHQKEISYRSVFEMSSSRRREQLYDQKGFDRQRWQDLVDEGTELRRAIKKIAHDYSTEWSMDKELDDAKAVKEIKKHEKRKHSREDEDDDDDRKKR